MRISLDIEVTPSPAPRERANPADIIAAFVPLFAGLFRPSGPVEAVHVGCPNCSCVVCHEQYPGMAAARAAARDPLDPPPRV